jgi:putative FmdB family regulatory protein
MPIYLFECRNCNHRFELLRPLNTKDDEVECPECHTKLPERLLREYCGKDPCSIESPRSIGCGLPC